MVHSTYIIQLTFFGVKLCQNICPSVNLAMLLKYFLPILGINISHYLQNTTLPQYPGCNANYVKHLLSSLSHCTSFSECKKLT